MFSHTQHVYTIPDYVYMQLLSLRLKYNKSFSHFYSLISLNIYSLVHTFSLYPNTRTLFFNSRCRHWRKGRGDCSWKSEAGYEMNTVLKDYDKIKTFAESPVVVTVSMISRSFYGKIRKEFKPAQTRLSHRFSLCWFDRITKQFDHNTIQWGVIIKHGIVITWYYEKC